MKFTLMMIMSSLLAMASTNADRRVGSLNNGRPLIVKALEGTIKTGFAAIGGETSGIMIDTDKGLKEIKAINMAVNAKIADYEDKNVVVTGYEKDVYGVERGLRKVFMVLEVYPLDQLDVRPLPPTEDNRICTAVFSYMKNPVTGECLPASNGCKINELAEKGFEKVRSCEDSFTPPVSFPGVCTAEFAYMKNPVTGECQSASNGCVIGSLAEAGFEKVNSCD